MTTIRVPDIGDTSNVTVIEVAVAPGDHVIEGDTLIVLESDKASMEIPADGSGVVREIHVSEGSEVNEGDSICELEGAESVTEAEAEAEVKAKALKDSVPSELVDEQISGASHLVPVPDTGSADGVTVIEIAVSVGDNVSEGDTLIVLESDKASMEIPAPASGVVTALRVSEGQQVVQGDPICEMSGGDATVSAELAPASVRSEPLKQAPAEQAVTQTGGDIERVVVPDTGNDDGVTVIEISVGVGVTVSEGDTLIVLESDKASMEIPSPVSGKVLALSVNEGDSVTRGDPVAEVEATGSPAPQANKAPQKSAQEAPTPTSPPAPILDSHVVAESTAPSAASSVHAGPAVRALARELGVNLTKVAPSGPRGRITKDDLHDFVKAKLKEAESGTSVTGGSGIPAIPVVDFEAFGPVERVPMTKIHKLTANNMTRCWLNVPSITQFDEADITDLEVFRKSMKAEAERRGVKLTPLPFLIKASAHVLAELPQVNASIDPATDEIIRKKYVHIGIAVDTPDGLMVPVIRDADQKGIWEISAEALELADKAKTKKLKPAEMQGATFTISSLGSIGGTAFTPIVPSPQAAILGISQASIQPVWDGSSFQPRLMLPLCLSYDHRVINGGDGARFTGMLGKVLGDIRHLVF
ncbi:MAG TPA: pyruvate dehydrogenase complex dihydrolipoyllysine-residue acetyltransferase [Gammaproteobacteria bacterium]|nr:pyruvate dehydrogenase complex dihydrolipoyllysine-residue acetyltransferase [Gammaproteobacteria bacterium]